MEMLIANLTRSLVCVVEGRMYADPELRYCLFHTDIILPVQKVSFIQGNHMSMILLHMLPALLDLLMLETKRSRYIYTDRANFLRIFFLVFPMCTTFCPLLEFVHYSIHSQLAFWIWT